MPHDAAPDEALTSTLAFFAILLLTFGLAAWKRSSALAADEQRQQWKQQHLAQRCHPPSLISMPQPLFQPLFPTHSIPGPSPFDNLHLSPFSSRHTSPAASPPASPRTCSARTSWSGRDALTPQAQQLLQQARPSHTQQHPQPARSPRRSDHSAPCTPRPTLFGRSSLQHSPASHDAGVRLSPRTRGHVTEAQLRQTYLAAPKEQLLATQLLLSVYSYDLDQLASDEGFIRL